MQVKNVKILCYWRVAFGLFWIEKFFQQARVVFHAPTARDACSNLLKTQLVTMIRYVRTLLLLAAPSPPFLGRIEAAMKMSSSSLAILWVCLCSRLNVIDWTIYFIAFSYMPHI